MSSNLVLRKEDKQHEHSDDTFEKSILRKVVKESWRNGITDAAHKSVSDMLEQHATRMEKLLGTFDYESLCMPSVTTNSKKMSRNELIAYLSFLEALAVGYKHRFNSDFASIFLAGLAMKARDFHSISRHFDFLMSGLEKRLQYYTSRSEIENKDLSEMLTELEKRESSFFKFFKQGEIFLLRKMIHGKTKQVRIFTKRSGAYSTIILKVKNARNIK